MKLCAFEFSALHVILEIGNALIMVKIDKIYLSMLFREIPRLGLPFSDPKCFSIHYMWIG